MTTTTAKTDGTDPAAAFDELLAGVTASAGRFGHREHVHLTWLAVRRFGMPAALGLLDEGIRRTATRAGVPEKYHCTLTRAWTELIAHHAAETGEDDFDAFADRHPALLDKHLPERFYRPATLAAPHARTGWAEPDLTPFPWQAR
ncbi:hypothetical protein ACFCV9_22020 [Streptomyces sp. NPDC056367]|uniref:hypothetical protein n=1 Tax=unclassified Streptomyces TaxID=2593676 RepID=UPI0035D8A342